MIITTTYMTQEGYEKLRDEITRLETVDRPKISQLIGEARDKGDLSENAEYDAAKEAQGMLESRIAEKKTLLASARIINKDDIGTDRVQILNRVTIKNTKNKQEMTYTLVAENEADLKQNKIAVNTPIAQGLMGKEIGDVVEIRIPSGIVSFEIMDISI